MSYSDIFKNKPSHHTDTPAQAAARTAAEADVKAKTDAKTAKNAASKAAGKPDPAAKVDPSSK